MPATPRVILSAYDRLGSKMFKIFNKEGKVLTLGLGTEQDEIWRPCRLIMRDEPIVSSDGEYVFLSIDTELGKAINIIMSETYNLVVKELMVNGKKENNNYEMPIFNDMYTFKLDYDSEGLPMFKVIDYNKSLKKGKTKLFKNINFNNSRKYFKDGNLISGQLLFDGLFQTKKINSDEVSFKHKLEIGSSPQIQAKCLYLKCRK
jgi:hypothetical protein